MPLLNFLWLHLFIYINFLLESLKEAFNTYFLNLYSKKFYYNIYLQITYDLSINHTHD